MTESTAALSGEAVVTRARRHGRRLPWWRVRQIVTRAAARSELPPGSDLEPLAQLPCRWLQNWRLMHDREPDDAVADRRPVTSVTSGQVSTSRPAVS
jgi:hypothetical protein